MPLRIRPVDMPRRLAPGVVAFGTGADTVTAAGVGATELGVLRLVDGSRSDAQLWSAARDAGVEPGRWEDLLSQLREHDIVRVVPESRVQDGPVLLVGEDRLIGSLRPIIGAAGHDVLVRDDARAAARVPSARLVVLVGERSPSGPDAVADGAALQWWAAGCPVLPVVRVDTTPFARVGPFLVPGHDTPCISCITRRVALSSEADPDGRAFIQGAGPSGLSPSLPVALTAAFEHVLLGVTAMLALDHLDGDPELAPGVSIDVCGPLPSLAHRRWSVLPSCPEHDGLPSYCASHPAMRGHADRRRR